MLRTYLVPLALSLAFVSGCVTSSPVIEDTSDLVDPETPANAEGALAVRKGDEHDTLHNTPAPGSDDCLDAAFLGSPDADTSARQIPIPCWKAVLQARPRLDEDKKEAESRLTARRNSLGDGLSAAEEEACEGLSRTEVALSPFYFKEDVLAVEALDKSRGARVSFDANIPNLTEGRMKKVIHCHLARARIICDPASADYCPLVLMNVETSVTNRDGRIVIEITGDSPEAGEAIMERVRSLQP